jgi:phage shock protein PspC (stress-responsive transcriptional regulator)
MNPRRLYRSRRDRQLAGVAAGMAEYLEIDPTLVRILWILSAFLGGFTILLYIILAFVIPLEPATMPAPGSWHGAGNVGDPGAGSPADGGAANPDGGAANPDGGAANSAWQAPGPDQRPDDRRGGRAGLFLGVLLIVFGAIAMANMLIPGWAVGGLLGPAFLVALGAALLVGSARRTTSEQ